MHDLQEMKTRDATKRGLPAPQGIGMAVAFDWGLAVQVLLMPWIALFVNQSSLLTIPGLSPSLNESVFVVAAFAGAFVLAWFGELVRSGRRWTYRIQIGANALLSVAGIFSLINLVHSASQGNFWPAVTVVILLGISPAIVWRMSRPATIRWFHLVSAPEARARHGGLWIWFIALWALIGGVFQSIAALK